MEDEAAEALREPNRASLSSVSVLAPYRGSLRMGPLGLKPEVRPVEDASVVSVRTSANGVLKWGVCWIGDRSVLPC